MRYQSFITKALKTASSIALKDFGKVSGVIKSKDPTQILTEADIAISKLIVKAISKEYSNHNIIDEEAGITNKHSKYTWVIDPIDGTANFVKGVALFGIMVGLLKDNCPIAGGVALPVFKEIYYAEAGKGAYLNGKKLKISNSKPLLPLISYTIEGYPEKSAVVAEKCRILSKILRHFFLQVGSGSVFDSMMFVKSGYAAVIFQRGKIWDHVAEHVIIEEAGGIYTDFYGRPMDYSNPLTRINENYTSCAAAHGFHRQLQKIIQKNI